MVDPSRRWSALDITLRASADVEAEDVEGALLAFLDDYSPTAITAPPGGEDGWLVTASPDVTPAWLARIDVDAENAPPPRARAWRVFFDSDEARDAARAALLSAIEWSARVDVAAVDVEDDGWAERSQASLQAVQVGRVIVAPPWDVPPADARAADALLVIIEPSMGFGTGHHESTRLCLRALQACDLAGRRVLDLGTGSGVLAVAAAILGAESVLALDDDRDAVDAARENVRLNGVEPRVRVDRIDLAAMAPHAADVVLANLTGALLRRHAASLVTHIVRDGLIIVSGFTEDERFAVEHAFSEQQLHVVRHDREAGWIGLTLRR
jgi:ribosomal protein L11 methyltransferase